MTMIVQAVCSFSVLGSPYLKCLLLALSIWKDCNACVDIQIFINHSFVCVNWIKWTDYFHVQFLSQAVDSYSVCQKMTFLWNLKIHHHFHRSPPLDPVMNKFTFSPSISLRSAVILLFHLCSCLQHDFFSWGFPTKLLCLFPLCMLHTFCVTFLMSGFIIVLAESS